MKTKKKAVKLAPKDYVKTLIWFVGGFGAEKCFTEISPTFQGPIPVFCLKRDQKETNFWRPKRGGKQGMEDNL